MIELYYRPGAASMPVHSLLEEVGADYRLRKVTGRGDSLEPPELLRLNPHGWVPALVDGELVLTESVACLLHLSDRFPEADLAPGLGTPERARWYRWLVYMTNTVQPAFLVYFYPDRYAPEGDAADAVGATASRRLAGMRDYLEGELAAHGPYLLGERFTSADLFLHALTRWGRRLEPSWWTLPHLGAHYRLVDERPAVRRMREQEELDDST